MQLEWGIFLEYRENMNRVCIKFSACLNIVICDKFVTKYCEILLSDCYTWLHEYRNSAQG